jgi:hypothetical protein
MTLKAKEEHMLLHFLWNLFSDALSSTHENEYDLESERGPDATPFSLNLCTDALSSTYENEYDPESRNVQMLLHFLLNLCSDALFSTHENEYDLEGGIGRDPTQFHLEFVYLSNVIDARERV